MNNSRRAGAGVIAALCLSLSFIASGYSQTRSQSSPKEAVAPAHASGSFEVKLTPQPPDDKAGDATIARMSADKQYDGDLEATGKGQMLAAGTGAKGSSGGIVGMERVTGTLHGMNGSFVLQHSGTMTRGAMQYSITVVPDSGTGQLAGLAGKMDIKIADGKHSYEFEYTIAETP